MTPCDTGSQYYSAQLGVCSGFEKDPRKGFGFKFFSCAAAGACWRIAGARTGFLFILNQFCAHLAAAETQICAIEPRYNPLSTTPPPARGMWHPLHKCHLLPSWPFLGGSSCQRDRQNRPQSSLTGRYGEGAAPSSTVPWVPSLPLRRSQRCEQNLSANQHEKALKRNAARESTGTI